MLYKYNLIQIKQSVSDSRILEFATSKVDEQGLSDYNASVCRNSAQLVK